MKHPRGRFGDCVERVLTVFGCASDNAQDVSCGSLTVEAFAQLIEQARILDGNDSLRGKVLQQSNLFVCEWLDLLPINLDDPDQLLFLQHRDAKDAARARESNNRRLYGIGNVARHLPYVGYLNYVLGFQYSAKRSIRRGFNDWSALSSFGVFGCRTVDGDTAKRRPLSKQKRPELCIAQSFGVCQQRFKHRCKIARRT